MKGFDNFFEYRFDHMKIAKQAIRVNIGPNHTNHDFEVMPMQNLPFAADDQRMCCAEFCGYCQFVHR